MRWLNDSTQPYRMADRLFQGLVKTELGTQAVFVKQSAAGALTAAKFRPNSPAGVSSQICDNYYARRWQPLAGRGGLTG